LAKQVWRRRESRAKRRFVDCVHLNKKKWKDKAFAAGVKREEIEEGATDLGVELWEHVGVVLAAMQEHATELGLDGSLASN
jgi:predicted hydrolase (HD superfamily)